MMDYFVAGSNDSGASHSDRLAWIWIKMLREATLADEQDVLDIDRDVHMGTDYLYDHYADTILSPGNKSYVYEKEGKVVGFIDVTTVDGGQTALFSSGRIAKEVRGQGLFGRIVGLALEDFSHSRDFRYVAMTTNSINHAENGERILRQYRVVAEKDMTIIDLDLRQIRTLIPANGHVTQQQHHSLRFQQLTRHDVSHMLQHRPDQLRHLFPEERIALQFNSLRIMEANAVRFFSGQTKVVATFPTSEPEANVFSSASSISQSQAFPIRLFSAGEYYSSKLGITYMLDVYGTGSDEELRAHLEWHVLRLATDSGENAAAMYVLYTRRLDDIVAEMQQQFSMWFSRRIPYSKMIAFERNFPSESALKQ